MNYTIGFDDEADEDLRNLSPHTKGEVNKVLRRLRSGPDRRRDLPLTGVENRLRAYAGRRWRVIFSVMPGRHIQVRRIRRRPDAYEGIEHPGSRDVREPAIAFSAEEESVPAAAAD